MTTQPGFDERTTGMPSRKDRRVKQKTRRKKNLRRTFLNVVLGTCLTVILMTGTMIFVGFATPWGNQMRLKIAETIVSTRHYYLARYITTEAEYLRLLKGLDGTPVLASSLKSVSIAATPTSPTRVAQNPITIIPLNENGYTGDVVLVHNPKLIRLVPAQVVNGEGEYITDMAKRLSAIAGINASGFEDPKGEGWGGIPVGLEYVDGQQLSASKPDPSWATVGFTKDGVMVLGNYSPYQLQQLGVRDAMQFHPELVVDGKPMITVGDGGWGWDPRTAIGQTNDGTVIFVVINGRFHARSIGASQKDVMDIMLRYGAVNACAMDGGSSSVLEENGTILNSPSTIDPNGQRHLPDAWLVFPTVAAANQIQ